MCMCLLTFMNEKFAVYEFDMGEEEKKTKRTKSKQKPNKFTANTFVLVNNSITYQLIGRKFCCKIIGEHNFIFSKKTTTTHS